MISSGECRLGGFLEHDLERLEPVHPAQCSIGGLAQGCCQPRARSEYVAYEDRGYTAPRVGAAVLKCENQPPRPSATSLVAPLGLLQRPSLELRRRIPFEAPPLSASRAARPLFCEAECRNFTLSASKRSVSHFTHRGLGLFPWAPFVAELCAARLIRASASALCTKCVSRRNTLQQTVDIEEIGSVASAFFSEGCERSQRLRPHLYTSERESQISRRR